MRVFLTYVTEKGQLALPATLRKELKLKKGTKVLIVRDGNKIYIDPIKYSSIFELQGIIKNKKVYTEKELEEKFQKYLATRKK